MSRTGREVSFKTIAKNRKAYFDYFVEESFEAGIALVGTEVKSIRGGGVSIKEAWCDISASDELFVRQMHISPYEQGNIFNQDPLRPRKLLMHRRQILQMKQAVAQQSYTLIPLSVYLKNSLIKIQVGLCRGKKQYDKRAVIAERDAKRSMNRAIKEHF